MAAPKWRPGAVATFYGWAQEKTGELIVSRHGLTPDAGTSTYKPNSRAWMKAFGLANKATNTSNPTISGTPEVGSTLTSTNGTWSGTPTPTVFTRQWQKDGVAIDGATAVTYVPVQADVGGVITVIVRGSNKFGYEDAISLATAAIIPGI